MSGARSRPSQAHTLYVAAKDKTGTGHRAVAIVSGAVGPLRAHGATFAIFQVKPRQMRDRRVLAAFRRRGVESLPAAIVHGGAAPVAVVGLRALQQYYGAVRAGLSDHDTLAAVDAERRRAGSRRAPSQRPPSSRRQTPSLSTGATLLEMETPAEDGYRPRQAEHDSTQRAEHDDAVGLDVTAENELDEYMQDAIRAGGESPLDS